jgi:hypothetical protein
MSSLHEQYNKMMDEGVSITELFVYNLIIEDDRCGGMSEKEIQDMVADALNCRYSTDIGLEAIVDRLLNGDDFSGDEDEWYY